MHYLGKNISPEIIARYEGMRRKTVNLIRVGGLPEPRAPFSVVPGDQYVQDVGTLIQIIRRLEHEVEGRRYHNEAIAKLIGRGCDLVRRAKVCIEESHPDVAPEHPLHLLRAQMADYLQRVPYSEKKS